MLFGFNATKCKTQCRLGVGRIKLLRNKKQIAMKSLRKEVAELLRQGKQGNARIRIEAVMREHRMLHAYEILELYLELLSVRAELLAKNKEIPPDMVEAICSLIYAGERVATDLAEVAMVAKMLVGKYGSVYKPSGFPEEVVSDLTCRKWQVNDTLVDCLAVTAPLPEMKLQFLDEIACEYGVEFDRDAAAMDMLPAAGKPGAVHSYAVEPLAPGGAGVLQPPPLAQGWQPPPGPAPALPPSAQQPAGWQPPCAASVAAAGHVSRMLSGGSVVVRSIGADALPSSSCSTADGPGWSPPQPEDVDKHGRAFLSHVGATAAWRQTRLHGVSQTSSCNTSQAGGNDYPPPATAAAPMDMPPPAVADVRFGGMPSTAQSSGSSTPPLGDKPVTPGSSYADASAAAEAAKQYSRMAQQAAARAEEFAAGQVAAEAKDGKELGCPDAGNSGDAGSLGSSGAASSATAVPRSVSDIQRVYDAAPGPPSKGEVVSPGPPSAPPSLLPPAPAPGPTSTDDAAPPDLDLPSVPGAGAPPPPAVQDELDELTKRFEMLKRR